MTRWTDFVKEYSRFHHISYGCAISQYKDGLKKAYKEYKKGEDWKDAGDEIIDVNDEINYLKNQEREAFLRKKKKNKINYILKNISKLPELRKKFLEKQAKLRGSGFFIEP